MHFRIVGEEELRDDLERQARRRDRGARPRRRVHARRGRGVRRIRCGRFPSLWEVTPLTAFEALAAGRPIVATDADGLTDILRAGHDSVIVPKRDADAIAGAVPALLGDPQRPEELAGAARRTDAGYDITTFVGKMERLCAIMHELRNKLARRGLAEADMSFLSV